jgi:hypothetical protein
MTGNCHCQQLYAGVMPFSHHMGDYMLNTMFYVHLNHPTLKMGAVRRRRTDFAEKKRHLYKIAEVLQFSFFLMQICSRKSLYWNPPPNFSRNAGVNQFDAILGMCQSNNILDTR